MAAVPPPGERKSFYAEGSERARQVELLFDKIARRYDLINDLQSFGLHRRWKRKLVQLAAVKPGDLCLDLCSGTGDIAALLARQGARPVALDFSEGMLSVGMTRPAASKTGWVRADALRIPFPDATFQAVTIGYGLRNLADFQGGLTEMLRVLRPGGTVLVLDFGKPEHRVWRALYFGYLRWLVPIFGKIFCGDSATHAYILQSLLHYPAQQGVARAMRELGCAEVQVFNLLGGVMSINRGVKR